MTPSGLMMIIALLLIAIFRKPILLASVDFEPVPDKYPLRYPGEMEPMFENFASIRDEIVSCTNEEQMKNVYTRILVFEGCYNDSATFTHELLDYYTEQEDFIKSRC